MVGAVKRFLRRLKRQKKIRSDRFQKRSFRDSIRRTVAKNFSIRQVLPEKELSDIRPNVGPLKKDWINPLQWLRWIGSFLLGWLISRKYTSTIGTIPILCCVGLLAWITVDSTGSRDRNVLEDYRSQFADAVEKEDFETASLLIGALRNASPENVENRYRQALVYDRLGKRDLAIESMQSLVDDSKHGLAAMWLVSQKLDLAQLESWTDAEHEMFRDYTGLVLEGGEENDKVSAKVLMANYLNGIGAIGESLRFYADLTSVNPRFALMAASLSAKLRDVEQTKAFARKAEKYFSELVSVRAGNVDARLGLAQSLVFAGREEEAARLLNDGMRIEKNAKLSVGLGTVLLMWANRLAVEEPVTSLLKRMQILDTATRVSPQDIVISQALVQTLVNCRDSEDSRVIELRERLLNSSSDGSGDFVRGTLALLENRFATAEKLLRKCARSHPKAPFVLNNLAIAISGADDGGAEQALRVINEALNALPEHPYLLETRGQILVKLERWHEAISDLEAAQTASELSDLVLPSLAVAYRGIGAEDVAKAVELRLEKLEIQ